MKTIALKVDVDTFRGTREGVPRLLEFFRSRSANATFLFSLGTDHTGRAIRRLPGHGLTKKSGFSALANYGLATLLYGTLLPGPDIGRRWQDILRSVEAAGFEAGLRGWDTANWLKHAAGADAQWSQEAFDLAVERFNEIFGCQPALHGAAGWQMNRSAYRLEQRMGFRYASDTRGDRPFWPVVEGEPVRCVQLPTTLPTLDEVFRADGVPLDAMHNRLIRATVEEVEFGHVFTLRAEFEGMKLLPVLERLFDGWAEQGYSMISLGDLYRQLDLKLLPYHAVEVGRVAGCLQPVAQQGERYPV